MKILVDIGHPGHVHYFKFFLKGIEAKGHTYLVTARKRGIIFELLDHFRIKYVSRGTGSNSFLGKLLYMFWADLIILIKSLSFKPDIYLSFSSPYAAQVAYILRKPHVALNDTEHTDRTHSKFTYPFSSSIITPINYKNDLGKKHIRLQSVIESLYLHKNYYTADNNLNEMLGILPYEEFVFIRLVAWDAHHDFGQQGFTKETIRQLINLLEEHYKIFISSESVLDDDLKQYQINIPAYKMHDVLAKAILFIGESGTMASESALLGTFAVYVNSLPLMCYLRLEQEYGLLKHFSSTLGVIDYVKKLTSSLTGDKAYAQKRDMMIEDFIDPVKFLIWFIEDYPQSHKKMLQNPAHQLIFK